MESIPESAKDDIHFVMEIVNSRGNDRKYSDVEIFDMLVDCNMDPHEVVLRIIPQETAIVQDIPANQGEGSNIPNQETESEDDLDELGPQSDKKNKRLKWTREEDDALLSGVKKYFGKVNKYALIMKDDDYKIKLKDRDNMKLKDRYRVLTSSKSPSPSVVGLPNLPGAAELKDLITTTISELQNDGIVANHQAIITRLSAIFHVPFDKKRLVSQYLSFLKSKSKIERDKEGAYSLVKSSALYIVHVAAEMTPVAKVGSLGDVVAGLGKALQRRGHNVEIILPKYDCMQNDRVQDLRALDNVVESYFDGKLYRNKIWVGTVEGLPVHFIEPQHLSKFFSRGKFYGEQDDFKRFSYFSRAALEFLLQSGKKPDIIHCHDWQTAFVAPLYWDLYATKGLDSARICFTCHNFAHQGAASASKLGSCGLDVNQLNRPDRMQHPFSRNLVNPVKGAIVFSDIVTTVSPSYAQEVQTPKGGMWLHSTLNFHSKKFTGILNGIDIVSWNPATDPFLKTQFNAKDLQGKEENKYALRKLLGLSSAESRRPLVGTITTLFNLKGVHLIRHAIHRTLELGGQFVLLGFSPVQHVQREFEETEQQFKNHDHVRLLLKYDEALSHSIYAASDLFFIPPIFEPPRFTQMIAMRYGSIPIAKKIGGNDSVFDIGFTIQTMDEQGLNDAMERAFKRYKEDEEKWVKLVEKVMNLDFSWASAAIEYEKIYTRSVGSARAAPNPT